MNKKLIALAVAAAVAPAAFAAENEVILYGQANAAIVIDNTNDNLFSIDSESSRIGLKGTENLGNGLSAFFQIESAVNIDDGSRGGFGTREGWVGLKSGGHSIGLGRGKSAFTKAYEEFDPWYQNTSFASMGYDIQGYTGTGIVPDQGDGGYAYRTNNTVRYSFGMEGLDVNVDYATTESKNDATNTKNGDIYSFSSKGTIGNFWIVGAGNIANSTSGNNSKLRNALLGGGTTFGDLSLSAAWLRHVYSADGYGTNKRNNYTLTAALALGESSFYGGVTYGDKLKYGSTKLNDSEFTKYGLGLAVPLSKRTVIATEFVGTDFGGSRKTESQFSSGIYHSF